MPFCQCSRSKQSANARLSCGGRILYRSCYVLMNSGRCRRAATRLIWVRWQDVLESTFAVTKMRLCVGCNDVCPIHVLTDKLEQTNLTATASFSFQFRPLEPTDGMALHRLVAECSPLDPNSSYCNLLQCSHFGSTSMAAVCDGELYGSVTGYRIPDRPDTLFVWQVAVHPRARGHGLARTLLRKLVAQPALRDIRFIETSITPGNEASWRLFTGFATELHAEMARSVMFDRDLHFRGAHETEHLVRIGPVNPEVLPAFTK